ncbi:MAG: HAD-IB family phosphatase [Akkermansiaceae bacterium]|jgi:phosphoserine phosphatase|nr:HAD-IB family phosphatase [Akkermansiaceae bacterium]
MKKIIAFDCDSTLSSIEGVDELARIAGDQIFQEVEDLTNLAMDGKVPVEEVFARRLDLIQPTRAQCEEVGRMYLNTVEPTAKETIEKLQAQDWECIIISGGFEPCITPLAQELGIARVEAVPLQFDLEGQYLGFDENYPTTRSGGKPEIIRSIRAKIGPNRFIMVGDGVSDLETDPEVDTFIGFFRYVQRDSVAQNCNANAFSISEILETHVNF